MRRLVPALALLAAPAAAQETAPPPPLAIEGDATLTSDYRFRGISRSDERVAIQGGVDLRHVSGLYAGAWASAIHGDAAAGADAEIDLTAGYRRSLGGWDFDGGLRYYVFAGSTGRPTDYAEPFLSAGHLIGPLGLKIGANYAWAQRSLGCVPDPRCGGGRADALYTFGEISLAIPRTPFSITAHAGESWGRSRLTAGLRRYTDWALTAAYTRKALTLSLGYVDTDIRRGAIVAPSGRNLGRPGVIGAAGFAF